MKNKETIDKAIGKITEEAMTVGTGLAIYIEEELTKICTTEEVAKKIILLEGKSIKGAIKEITKIAKGKQKQGVTLLTHEEVREISFKYYELTDYLNKKPKEEVLDVLDFM